MLALIVVEMLPRAYEGQAPRRAERRHRRWSRADAGPELAARRMSSEDRQHTERQHARRRSPPAPLRSCARPQRPRAWAPISSRSRPSARMNGSRTSSRTAFSACERKRIWISGAPGMRTRTAAIGDHGGEAEVEGAGLREAVVEVGLAAERSRRSSRRWRAGRSPPPAAPRRGSRGRRGSPRRSPASGSSAVAASRGVVDLDPLRRAASPRRRRRRRGRSRRSGRRR